VDLLFRHNQNKKDRKSSATSICDLKLFGGDDVVILCCDFNLEYHRYGTKKHVTFIHKLEINLNTGDIDVTYKIDNNNLTDEKSFKSTQKIKKNDFKMLGELIDNGFYRGEKRLNYWGVKYERALNNIVLLITNKLKTKFKEDFYSTKSYKNKNSVNELFDIIVDFHLNQKNIKGHDYVYFDIMDVYPTKKHLKNNDNKFLPAVLDSYGIKSKYLIKELNTSEIPLNITAVKYFCKLFGDNHLDYLKKMDWKSHCVDVYQPRLKIQELKNEFEKNSFVKLINNWSKGEINLDPLFYSIEKLLMLRSDLEKYGLDIKLTPKNDAQFNNTFDRLTNLKQYYKRGYKLKYSYPDEFVKDIETEIKINDLVFNVKILTTEEEFIQEGFKMKNCMSKQFSNGLLYVYLTATHNKKTINLQYRKGELVQSYGKTNTTTPSIFLGFIDILNKKFKKYGDIKWVKTKYDNINS